MASHFPAPGRDVPLCDEVAAASSELLLAADLVDGECSAAERQRLALLRRHLSDCAACRAELAAAAARIALLRELPAPPADPRRIVALRAALRGAPEVAAARVAPIRAAPARAPRSSVAPLEWAALLTAALVLAGALVRYSPVVARLFAASSTGSAWLLPLLFLGVGSVLSLIALPLLRSSFLHAAVGDALPPCSP